MSSSPSPYRHHAVISGRYAIRKKLGSGGLGTVYLAQDLRDGRRVALKLIRADRLSSEAAARLQKEFQAFAGLHHPQIATAHDFGYTEDRGLPYYTREYIEGTPLAPGPPAGAPPREFLGPILDLLSALEYLHAHGILHLDIHPGNLIVAGDPARGGVLIDFGLIRALDGPRLSASGETLSDLPPEVLRGEPATAASDLFLVGRLLLWRLTGEAVGEGSLPGEIAGWGPRLTLELERIAGKALKDDLRQRFQSAAEFRDAILGALGEPGARRRPPEPGEVTLGREAELERIDRVLRQALEGSAAALCISGADGTGKTRLLAEARVRAQLLGLEVVEVRFFPPAGSADPLRGRLEAAGAGRHKKLRWLEPLASRHGGTPEERARRAARAFFEEGGKPLALTLDDLDLADRESRVLAEALLRECAERRSGAGRGMAIFTAAAKLLKLPVRRSDQLVLKPLKPGAARDLLKVLVRPLEVSDAMAGIAAARARGSPLLVRRMARALTTEWGEAGIVPPAAELPSPLGDRPASGILEGIGAAEREVLDALAGMARPAQEDELAALLSLDARECRRRLLRLRKAEVLADRRQGRGRTWWFDLPGAAEVLLARLSPSRVRSSHRRLAAHLGSRASLDLAGREDLARHRILGGQGASGLRLARSVARELRDRGALDRAVDLLEAALSKAGGPRARFSVAEEISSILAENGDHKKGVDLLEPFYRRETGRLSPREGIRLRRRLGVHYHRSGRADDAMGVFTEAERLAEPKRDLEDLIFIDSEIAELCMLQGRPAEAEEACRRGFERLRSLAPEDEFKARMEVTLRATQGHLELRRLRLPAARRELVRALKLARRLSLPALEAIILNNLGIVENQLNDFAAAQTCLHGAEKLLLAAGERQAVITIASNLAVIAAKLGQRDAAHAHLERATALLRHHAGRRREFFVAVSRGMAASLLGDAPAAIEVLTRTLPVGREVGDRFLSSFGEVYLADACLACGRYDQALKRLQLTAREARRSGTPLLARMVHARIVLLAVLIGHSRLALRSRRVLETVARTDVELMEAWNDLYLGLAGLLLGEEKRGMFEGSLRVFQRLEVAPGERFARLCLLAEAIARGERPALDARLHDLAREGPSAHRFLAVAVPLACAEACLIRGDVERTREFLSEASSAIVGQPFLELDWRIELLRARLEVKCGDPGAAREHIHRSLHTRDLIFQLLPAGLRSRVLDHPRFGELHRLSERLTRSPGHVLRSDRLRALGLYQGMIGRSREMVRVFQEIDRLRDQEMPVLITGDTGTGKELAARAIHRTSPRAKGPFFAIHCASLPLALFESELFGYEAGAFSGAEAARPGLLETLSGGTLLLDGVSELPIEAQAKLLRVLDSGVIRRVGGVEERPVDVRFLASSSVDLRVRAEAGAFRQDLFFRLSGMEIHLPALRDRREDLGPLARHFLEKHARRLDRPVPSLSGEALSLLEAQEWPGNVREMETVLLRAVVSLAYPESVGARDLEPLLAPREPAPASKAGPSGIARLLHENEELLEGRTLEELKSEVERVYITRLFRHAGGDLQKVMDALGVKRSNFYTLLRNAGLDIRALRRELR